MWKVWSRKVRTSQQVLELQWNCTFQFVLQLLLSRAMMVAARALPSTVLRGRNPLKGFQIGAGHSVLQLQLSTINLLAGRLLVILTQFPFPIWYSWYFQYYFSLSSDVSQATLANSHISLQLDFFSLCLTDLVYIWVMVKKQRMISKMLCFKRPEAKVGIQTRVSSLCWCEKGKKRFLMWESRKSCFTLACHC